MGPSCHHRRRGQPQLMYVDQHYIHEVTSPQAFQGLRDAGRRLRRPDLTFGTFDTMSRQSISTIFEMSFPRLKLISWLKMLRSLGLNMRPMVLKNKELFTWLDQKLDGLNQENSSSVEIVTQQPTELSERSLLELGPVRSNMSLRHRPSGRSNPRKCW